MPDEEMKSEYRSQPAQYKHKHNEVTEQVKELRSLLRIHESRTKGFNGESWALLGDLNRCSQYLREAIQSLK